MKVLIVGGVAGGASVAARVSRIDEHAEIIMFEKGPHVSFSNCCLPYRLSNTIEEYDSLILMNPEVFKKQYNINARVNQEVVKIDRESKTVTVKNLLTNETYTETYDKLVLAPGANAIVPPIKGIETADTFIVKNVVDITKLNEFITKNKCKKVTVIGGGFIGVETCENLVHAGYEVSLVEAEKQILRPFDYDMVQIFHKTMLDHGVNLVLNDKVVEFEGNNVKLESGRIIESDAIVLAIGVRPDTKIASEAGIKVSDRGAILVDPNYVTSDKDIYAVGDAILVWNSLLNKYVHLPLAGPAQKEARQAANHMYGIRNVNTGFIGSSCIRVFDYNGASTGLTERDCIQNNLSYDVAYVIPQDKVGLMPNNYPLHYKLIYEVPTGRVLGCQAISKGEAAKRVDIVATLIKFGGTIYDLMDLELCYAPPFSTAKDAGNHAGLVASNLLSGSFKQVRVDKVRELVESGAYIIDVREKDEYDLAHIKGAKNIPLSEIRERLSEIPTDRPVYLHCRSSQRSYNACRCLIGNGFTNVYNIQGSFLGISFYEYFNDVYLKRDPIVTDYNFN